MKFLHGLTLLLLSGCCALDAGTAYVVATGPTEHVTMYALARYRVCTMLDARGREGGITLEEAMRK